MQQTTLHGTFVDLNGIGTIIRGESGIGKSECALSLIRRGHSLVADDVIHVKLLAKKGIMGTGSKLCRGYIECRGIGIVNVVELFGIHSVCVKKRIDIVLTFKKWVSGMIEAQTGLNQEYFEILGRQVPHIEVSVKPGRDMSQLVEIATMMHKLKRVGYNSANEFNERLINHMKTS